VDAGVIFGAGFAPFRGGPLQSARIRGVDYVDGGVRHTANIDVAIEKGDDLIICYNPFRPFLNRIDAEDTDSSYFAEGRYLADRGLKAIINQVFRTLLHVDERRPAGRSRDGRQLAVGVAACSRDAERERIHATHDGVAAGHIPPRSRLFAAAPSGRPNTLRK